MHKEPKCPINIEVLADGNAFVPHETKAPGNALPFTAEGNRGGKMLKRGRCAVR